MFVIINKDGSIHFNTEKGFNKGKKLYYKNTMSKEDFFNLNKLIQQSRKLGFYPNEFVLFGNKVSVSTWDVESMYKRYSILNT
jgi:hypothetical protein